MKGPSRAVVYGLLGAVLVGAGYALWSMGVLAEILERYQDVIEPFTDRKKLRTLVLGYGRLAPLVFVVLQVVQVVLSFVPGEATGILGGFLFGAFWGFVYSSVGLTVGSLICFGLARWLGQPFVRRWIQPEFYQKFLFLQEPRGIAAVFVLFLIPGFPKDYLSYILGVSPLPLWAFCVAMTLGRMPGTWILSLQGDKFHAGESYAWIFVFAVSACLFLLAYLYRGPIMDFVRRHRADSP
jgi:uncharacterized membrane protein YdjX (TVP38/TMEM64 family)